MGVSSPCQVNLTSENPVTLSAGTQLDFTYSVDWTPTSTPFHRRFDRYLDYDFFEHQVGIPHEQHEHQCHRDGPLQRPGFPAAHRFTGFRSSTLS